MLKILICSAVLPIAGYESNARIHAFLKSTTASSEFDFPFVALMIVTPPYPSIREGRKSIEII